MPANEQVLLGGVAQVVAPVPVPLVLPPEELGVEPPGRSVSSAVISNQTTAPAVLVVVSLIVFLPRSGNTGATGCSDEFRRTGRSEPHRRRALNHHPRRKEPGNGYRHDDHLPLVRPRPSPQGGRVLRLRLS